MDGLTIFGLVAVSAMLAGYKRVYEQIHAKFLINSLIKNKKRWGLRLARKSARPVHLDRRVLRPIALPGGGLRPAQPWPRRSFPRGAFLFVSSEAGFREGRSGAAHRMIFGAPPVVSQDLARVSSSE